MIPRAHDWTSRPMSAVKLALGLGVVTLVLASPPAAADSPAPPPAVSSAPTRAVEESADARRFGRALRTLPGARLADTRPSGTTIDGDFAGAGKRDAGSTYEVTVAGRGGVPAGAVGAVMNLAAVDPDGAGYFTVYDCAPPRPNASALNYVPGVDVANEIVAALSPSGSICVFTFAGAHVLVDVVGYVLPGDSVVSMRPARVAESRQGGATIDGLSEGFGRTDPGSTTNVPIEGRAGVPEGIDAAIVNVTAIDPFTNSFVTVHACLPRLPVASSLNHAPSVNRANELITQVDPNGDICIYTDQSIHLTVDVVGYVLSGSDLHGVGNARLLDTRGDPVLGRRGGRAVAPGSTTVVQVAGRGEIPGEAVAAVVNVAAVDPGGPGFLTVGPCGNGGVPATSSLNFATGVNGANELVAVLDENGRLCIYSSASTDLLLDVAGYVEHEADVSIAEADDVDRVVVDPVLGGGVVSYTVTVENAGPSTAENVVATDRLPRGVTFAKSFGCGNDPNGMLACDLGDLEPGATATFSIFAHVDPGTRGTVVNRVAVGSDTADPDLSNNAAVHDATIIERAPGPPGLRGEATVGVVDQDTGLWLLVEPIVAALQGSSEAPAGSGDPSANGRAQITVNERDDRICFDLDLFNFRGNVTAAHIHRGAAGVNGPVVLDLDWPTNGSAGCLDTTAELIDQILADLDGFYVNVHSDAFPAGAVRGQLGGGPLPTFFFGNPGDDPFLGDWDGDGISTPGLYRPSDGKVIVRNSHTSGFEIEFFYGSPDDVPIIGDWDGDGDDTLGLYRPSENRVLVANRLGTNGERVVPDVVFTFGDPGDDPFAGDFDDDGFDTVGVRRGRTFWWRNSLTAGAFDNGGLLFGDLDDDAMFGDWDGDGLDTPGVYRRSTSTFFLRNRQSPGIADMEIFADGFESGDTAAWSTGR